MAPACASTFEGERQDNWVNVQDVAPIVIPAKAGTHIRNEDG